MERKIMKAIRIKHFGGPEQLTLEEVPRPEPKQGELLVRVRATSINPIDWKFREGMFGKLALPYTPGGDFAGVVESLGSGTNHFRPGDEVYGVLPGSIGAEAEYAVTPAATTALKPKSLDFVAAAAVPLAGLTAWQAVFDHAGIKKGQRVLILGASAVSPCSSSRWPAARG
jgi:NADPH:quinone reductase-like Zn-dependent oxidoreductase